MLEIQSEKQPNGLWGMPLQCHKIDTVPFRDEGLHLKFSAICIGIAERYPDETFEIFWSNSNGFFIKLSESGIKRIVYENYTLIGNKLVWKDLEM
jgi:hypothetical protein